MSNRHQITPEDSAVAVVAALWMTRAPLGYIASRAHMTVNDVLETVSSLNLPARHTPLTPPPLPQTYATQGDYQMDTCAKNGNPRSSC